MNIQRLTYALIAFLVISLSACGGSTGGGDDPVDPTDPANPTDPNQPTQETVRIGSFNTGGVFSESQIGTNDSMLTAGESASLSVSLVDENGSPVTDAADIFFSSTCAGTGLSEISPAVAQNVNGTVNVTYTARGCDGSDTVTANTSVGGVSLNATTTLQTQQAPVGSIQFSNVSESIIGIQGSGSALPEQSIVTFRLTNISGGPVPNRQVSFSLNTDVGGIALSNQESTTNASGEVSTTVSSGTVATVVRVTAQAMRDDGSTTTTQSNGLAITTGIPDQNSFSVSATLLNIEGGDRDGTETMINVRAADRFNNPVPDGTAINFRTEGGSIPGSCVTSNGGCSVTLTSQNPRPSNGRVTVLATAIGEESFVDGTPSNGQYDAGEDFVDLGEAFLDENEDGIRQASEPFLDFDSDGTHDNEGGNTFTGLLCNGNCDSDSGTLNVRGSIVIVFSGSTFFIDISPSPITLMTGGAPQPVQVFVRDANGQAPAEGTVVSVSTSQGTIDGPSSETVASINENQPFVTTFFIAPADEPGQGVFRVEVTSPVTNTVSRDFADVVQ